MDSQNSHFINREISWLAFNSRVLQEAADPAVPLIERIKFLGIFSSNLDEFFRVHVATMKRLLKLGKDAEQLIDGDPEQTLDAIQQVITQQQERFERVYKQIFADLAQQHIAIVGLADLTDAEKAFVQRYYVQKVRPSLVPMMLEKSIVPDLQQDLLYLGVRLERDTAKRPGGKYAVAEVPTRELSRFVLLPSSSDKTRIIMLEDVVRFGLQDVFSIFKKFGYHVKETHPFKITKDAELDIDDDLTQSFIEKISQSVKKRAKGQPLRLTHDTTMDGNLVQFFAKLLRFSMHDTILPEGRYLNFKDFIKFPSAGTASLRNPAVEVLPHKHISSQESLLKTIRKRDILLHYPYQSFHYMIDLLREAAVDPNVTSIRMTLYRVAPQSKIINALSKAAQNGKAVTAVFEFQARFDEEANISWANKLIEDGVRVIQGIPDLKVHVKLCLITRKERGKTVRFAAISTGNFNEDTAKIYGDHTLFTADERLTSEVRSLFSFLRNNYKVKDYKHLVVSPFAMRQHWKDLIEREIDQARAGEEAWMLIKLNSLVDHEMIGALYQASQAGVKIRLIIRGICALIPGMPGLSENIEAISIVDKYLEHSRIFVFGNGGDPQYFISSADWMTRNLDHRVEVACPIYAKQIQRELQIYLDIQWRDNVKARILNGDLDNRYRPRDPSEKPIRAQDAIYDFLKRDLSQRKTSRIAMLE